MKIAIDAHRLDLKYPTGLTTYVKNLAASLLDLGHDVFPIYAFSPKKINAPLFFQQLATADAVKAKDYRAWGFHAAIYFLAVITRLPILRPGVIESAFELELRAMQDKLPAVSGYLNLPHLYRAAQAIAAISKQEVSISAPKKVGHFDILHLTTPLPISLRGAKKIVTIHDLVPLKVPSSTLLNLHYYLKIVKTSLKSADLVFAISEHTKKDLIEILKIPAEKIFVTYQSSSIPKGLLNLTDDDILPILQHYNLRKGKYFIFYGTIEPKKNVLNLLQAFSLARTDCQLVVLGQNGWLHEETDKFFDSPRYKEKIIRIAYTDFVTVTHLLKGARALLFPSIYEGFGLPVLNAMQLGTPVITSNTSSLPEVGGDAVHYVDPYSVLEIKSAITAFSGNDERLKKMSDKGLVQAEKFSLKQYKRTLSAGYELLFK